MASERRARRGKKAKAEIVERPAPRITGLPAGYPVLLDELKRRIRAVQLRAVVSVNHELIALYWHIGKSIVERQRTEGWGKTVVERLSRDLQREFPGVGGFSAQNIWYMRAFYLAWTDDVRNLQQPVGELDVRRLPESVARIPWGHNIQIITKLTEPAVRLWYAQKAVELGWSRAVLVHQIESGLFKRQGKAITKRLSRNSLRWPEAEREAARQGGPNDAY